MRIRAEKTQGSQAYSPAISGAQRGNSASPASGIADDRPSAAKQRQLQAMADHSTRIAQLKAMHALPGRVVQREAVTQLVLDQEDVVAWAATPPESWKPTLSDAEILQVKNYLAQQGAAAAAAAAPAAAGGGAGAAPAADEKKSGMSAKQAADSAAALKTIRKAKMIDWVYDKKLYHINLTTDTFHVTYEVGGKVGKIHYFFKGSGDTISDEPAKASERGIKGGKLLFSALPPDVQAFIKANWNKIT